METNTNLPPRPGPFGWKRYADKVCNALTDRTAKFLEKYLGVDLIIVTGPAGTGKSSFIKSVTGNEIYTASTLESGTRQTALVPTLIGGKKYLFLDMPGFDAIDLDDWQIFIMLTTSMATIERYVNFRGLIYVDSFDNVRATKSAEKILKWVHQFCGSSYMANVTIVTTKWDVQADDAVSEKLERYATWRQSALLQPLVSNGATTFHHGLVWNADDWRKLSLRNQQEERNMYARAMIRDRYGTFSNFTLKFYREIAQGSTVEGTSAGKCLRPGPSSQPRQAHQPNSSTENSTRFDWAKETKSWISLLLKAARVYREISGTNNTGMWDFESEPDINWEDGFLFEEDEVHDINLGDEHEELDTSSRCTIL